MINIEIGGGWEEDKNKVPPPCLSREHEPPNMLYIPHGKVYTHVCPACGRKITLRGNHLSYN